MKLTDIIIGFSGILGALVLAALPCHLLFNNFYLVGGKITDFSIWAYGGCGVLWAVVWNSCQPKIVVLR